MSAPIAKLTIRPAAPKDAATILRLIRDLASFETLLDQVRVTEADILRDGFGAKPRFECLLAELDRAASSAMVGCPEPRSIGRGME